MRRRALAAVYFVALVTAVTFANWSLVRESRPQPQRVSAAAPAAGAIAVGEQHTFVFRLERGQVAHLTVEQQGIDLIVTVGHHVRTSMRVNSNHTAAGAEDIWLYGTSSDDQHLEVAVADAEATPGRYSLQLVEVRAASRQDRQLVTAETHYAKARVLQWEGSAVALRQALQEFSAAARTFREISARSREADALADLGLLHHALGDNTEAARMLSRARQIHRESGNGRGEANALAGLGLIYWATSDNARAAAVLDDALTQQRALGDLRGSAQTLHLMARVHAAAGQFKQALDTAQSARALSRQAGDRRGEAATLTNIGLYHWNTGIVDEALRYYDEALALRRATRDARGEADTLNALGLLQWFLGDYDRAIAYYERTLILRRHVGDLRGEGITLHNLAYAYSGAGAHSRAIAEYQRALPIKRAVGDRREVGSTLSLMADDYAALGDVTRALAAHQEALSLKRETGAHDEAASTLIRIGELHLQRRDPAAAEAAFADGLNTIRATKYAYGESNLLQRIAAAYTAAGDAVAARPAAERAIELLEAIRSSINSQDLRASFTGSSRRYYETYIDVLMALHGQSPGAGHDRAALEIAERSRTRALVELLAATGGSTIGVAGPTEFERRLQQDVARKTTALATLIAASAPTDRVMDARQSLDATTASYDKARRNRQNALTLATRPLRIDDIRALLDPDTTLIEYVVGTARSYAWVVTTTGFQVVELPSRAVIDDLARRAHDSLTTSGTTLGKQQAIAATEALSAAVVRPLSAWLQTPRLIIVADGALEYVPFAAMSKVPFGEPLIAQHEVMASPSASALSLLRRSGGSRAARSGIAVIADPVLETSDPRLHARDAAPTLVASADLLRSARDVRLQDLRRLPFTSEEAESIAAYAAPGTVFKAIGFDASREVVTTGRVSDYRILHFATHALVNAQHPELSGIVLSLVDADGNKRDGFLRVHDIYQLGLRADLVVLSACRTALGKEIRGEGLFGLTRAFMAAGATSVVASLWDVRDRATAELMRRFYQRLLTDGLRPTAALRQAQLSMLREPQWQAPYFWAGFVLQGDWK